MDWTNISRWILSGIGKTGAELVKDLQANAALTNFERGIIYSRYYPTPILDGELKERIQRAREGDFKGTTSPSEGELSVLWNAFLTQQYGKYITHLLLSYDNPYNVSPTSGDETYQCDLCGKDIYGHGSWFGRVGEDVGEQKEKEWLAFHSRKSDTHLCLDCIAQLKYLMGMISDVEPGILRQKRF